MKLNRNDGVEIKKPRRTMSLSLGTIMPQRGILCVVVVNIQMR
jgi:hypothetical protein